MALFKKDDVSIYHPHIPRTGGRYIAELFAVNKFSKFHDGFEHTVRGIEVPHLHYPLYNFLECVPESKKIAIVRNPYDRFVSQIKTQYIKRLYPVTFFDMIKDKEWLFSFLDYEREVDAYITNWFRPQHEYIEEGTLVYKFEDGLNENFVNWIKKNFDIEFEFNNNINYEVTDVEINAKNLRANIDPIVRQHIQEYYKEDYTKLNYVEEQS